MRYLRAIWCLLLSFLRPVAVGLVVVALLYFSGCSYRNVDQIKSVAHKVWADAGYEVVGYEGYQIGSWSTPGGKVWYIVRRKGNPSITYHAFLSKWWDGEYHIYNLQAIDAIAP